MTRIPFPYFLLCVFLWSACIRVEQAPKYPPPPATSYRVESIEPVIRGTTYRSYAAFVTPQFIDAVRVEPLLGRYFVDQEYQPRSGNAVESLAVVVLAHEFWRQRFRSDPAIVGDMLELSGRKYIVVGVLPKEFKPPEEAEILLPEAAANQQSPPR